MPAPKDPIKKAEWARKIGIASLGNKNMVGRHRSRKTKLKLRLANLGKKHTDVTKQKMSIFMKEKVKNGFKPPSPKGRILSDKTKEKMSKNNAHYWKGRKQSEETIKKRIPKISGENSGTWRADNVGYHGIHKWLAKNFGKADLCESKDCPNNSKVYQWALKRGCKYERKRENFIKLCASCHSKYDFTEEKRKRFLRDRYNGKKYGRYK